MAVVLGVGIATLDIINLVERYPAEDEEIRAVSQRRSRGGNATNTLVVLSELGHRCAWAGVLPREADGEFVREDLERHRIDLRHVERPERGKLPVSCILASRSTGSRTIVHYRDLPEYPFEAFDRIDLSPFHWLHFEGRAVEELAPMLEKAATRPVPVSLEVEKPRAGIERLFGLPDLLLFSRVYALSRGFDSPETFLRQAVPAGSEAWLAWGDTGAWSRDRQGRLHFHAAPRVEVVDSLGAGDSFNAGVIHGHLSGWAVPRILEAAVNLASAKCARQGFDGLAEALE